MRRSVLVLGLAFLMALALSAVTYAANITGNGYIGFRTVFAQFGDDNYEFKAQRRAYGNIYLRGSKGPVSANFRYYLQQNGTDGWRDMNGSGLGTMGNASFLDAYADYKGAIIPGLIEGTTLTVGRFVINENDWIGRFERREGMRLSGLKLGPAELTLVSFWPGSTPSLPNPTSYPQYQQPDNTTAVKVTGSVDIVDLEAMVVSQTKFNDPDKEESKMDFFVGASATPIRNLTVGAELASNGKTKKSGDDPALAWKVTGELATISNLTLRGSLWYTDSEFRPTYPRFQWAENLTFARSITTSWDRSGYAWGDLWMENGFSVGAETVQAGIPLDVEFRMGTIFESNVPGVGNAAFAGKGMTVVSAGTEIAKVKADVKLTMIEDKDDPVIDVIGSRSFRVGFLGGNVNLRGTLRLHGEEDPEYAGDLTWSAPNGVVIGLHYASYDRGTNWNHNANANDLSEGFNIGKSGEADGFAITMGYQLNAF